MAALPYPRLSKTRSSPLTDALTAYYKKQSAEMIEAKLTQDKAEGKPLPGDPEQVSKMIDRDDLLAEEV